jgi:hypothetical protein
MNSSNTLYFDLKDEKEVCAMSILIRELNEAGVPYRLEKDGLTVTFEITNGY